MMGMMAIKPVLFVEHIDLEKECDCLPRYVHFIFKIKQVEKLGSLYNIHLRTGCFCNTGACQKFLNLTNEQIKNNLSAGHVCGDDVDLIEGKPTGSVRISFGYMSNFADAKTFLTFLHECFLEGVQDDASQRSGTTAHRSLIGVPDTDINDGDTENQTVSTASSAVPQVLHKGNTTEVVDCHKSNVQEDNTMPNNREKDLPLDLQHSVLTWGTTITQLEQDCSYSGLRLEQICLYPIKSCAAFKVIKCNIVVTNNYS